jgi:tRNA-modifying protein YgfZ
MPHIHPLDAAMNSNGGRLTSLGVLRIKGSDALSFLQGQLSNDMQLVQAGRCVLAACSNSSGRVLAILRVFARGDEILALLPKELVSGMLLHLRKYVLRAKVQIEDASEVLAVGGIGTEALRNAGFALPAAAACAQVGDLTLAAVPGDGGRFWVLGPAAALLQQLGWQDSENAPWEQRWRWHDVQAGLPQIYANCSEAFVAQMLNLDLLQGISFTKGCYTGQEIIARAQHLGRIKRRLFKVVLPPGSFEIGATIKLADGRSGRLTEVARCEGQTLALAVMNLEVGPAETDTPEAQSVIPASAQLPDYVAAAS